MLSRDRTDRYYDCNSDTLARRQQRSLPRVKMSAKSYLYHLPYRTIYRI
jgi:hypothetical protein